MSTIKNPVPSQKSRTEKSSSDVKKSSSKANGLPFKTISFEEMNKELGISEKDLAEAEEDEFE